MPFIGANGNWWVGGVDLKVPASGKDGATPQFQVTEIGELQVNYPPSTEWETLVTLATQADINALQPFAYQVAANMQGGVAVAQNANLPLDTVVFNNTDGGIVADLSTGVLTINTAGVYRLSSNAVFNGSSLINVLVNGATLMSFGDPTYATVFTRSIDTVVFEVTDAPTTISMQLATDGLSLDTYTPQVNIIIERL